MRCLLFISVLVLPFFGKTQDCDSVPEINQKIVALALEKNGKKVDRGECWDLAKYVLNETGADWDGFEGYGQKYNYKSGCIYPGDIIQFEKVKISYKEGNVTYTENMYHHTAIVVEVLNDNELVLSHQNTAQHGRKVGKTVLKLDSVKSGKMIFYHPEY